MTRRPIVAAFLFLFFPSVFAPPGRGQGTPSAAEYLRRAQAHLDQRDYRQARAAAQNAVRLDPRSAEAEHLLGRAEYALGHLDPARRHLQHALALDPGLIAAHQQLAELFVGEGAYELAIPELEQFGNV
jgi:tetratricopeptide (TPR) repeat protein